MKRRAWAIAVLITGLLFTARGEATMVLPLSMEEMAQRAEKIFVGTCTKVERSVNPQGIPVIQVTFAVSETLKGEVGKTVTFQQLDPTPPPQQGVTLQGKNLQLRRMWTTTPVEVPSYSPGEELLLFLASPGKLGLTAPVGLSQGKLPVKVTATGEKLIVNTAQKDSAGSSALPAPGKAGSYSESLAALRTLLQSAPEGK